MTTKHKVPRVVWQGEFGELQLQYRVTIDEDKMEVVEYLAQDGMGVPGWIEVKRSDPDYDEAINAALCSLPEFTPPSPSKETP